MVSQPQAATVPFIANGVTNCGQIQGDGIVTFDRLASRWIIAAHNSGQLTYYYCVAISNTDDLSSTSLKWFTYAFPLDSILGSNGQGTTYFPDWPKFATWGDAYYLGIDLQDPNNGYQEVGVVACALDRADMLIGATALAPQCFHSPSTITGNLFLGHSLEPADVEGTTPPPTGAPEYFVSIENPVADGVTTTSSNFNLFQFHVDWSNPANSTFTQSTVPVSAFTPGCYLANAVTNTVCVPEPSTATTTQAIDSVGDRFMFRFAYRNFGTYQSYLVSHTVQVGTGTGTQTGIRWYELRGNGVPTLNQSGTISPDTSLFRFMPSITQDQMGNAAVGYSVSSASTHPGIRASWWNLNSQTSPTEISLFAGTADQENTYHWGDYTNMTVDPVDGCTFWYANEYFTTNQIGTGKPVWQTRIANFSAPGCASVTLTPSSLTFASQAVGTHQSVAAGDSEQRPEHRPYHHQYFRRRHQSRRLQAEQQLRIERSLPADLAPSILHLLLRRPARAPRRSASPTARPIARKVPDALRHRRPRCPNHHPIDHQRQLRQSSGRHYQRAGLNHRDQHRQRDGDLHQHRNHGDQSRQLCPVQQLRDLSDPGQQLHHQRHILSVNDGSYSAAVTLTDNAANNPQSVGLSGNGIAPVTLSATSVAFGTVLVGTSKTANAVTLTNKMNVALTGITVVASGTGYSQVNTCGTSIAAGATCTITATFTPTAAGAVTGAVTITDSAKNSPQTITLTGTGQLPVAVAPTSLNFGTVTVGTTSAAKTVSVTNNLKTTLTITSIGFNGPGRRQTTLRPTPAARVWRRVQSVPLASPSSPRPPGRAPRTC